jgi:hypothetical protein
MLPWINSISTGVEAAVAAAVFGLADPPREFRTMRTIMIRDITPIAKPARFGAFFDAEVGEDALGRFASLPLAVSSSSPPISAFISRYFFLLTSPFT